MTDPKETRTEKSFKRKRERLNLDNMGSLDCPGERREMLGYPEAWGPKEGVLFQRCISPLLSMDPVLLRVSSKVEVDGDISDHDLR